MKLPDKNIFLCRPVVSHFFKMKNLLIRALSGSVYVALIVCGILFGGLWAFPLLCCVFTFLGIIEFQRMTLSSFFSTPITVLVDIIIGVSIPATSSILLIYPDVAFLLLLVIFIMVITRFVIQLYLHVDDPVRHIAISLMSWCYISLPLALLAQILNLNGGASLLLLMFTMIWLNDTGAFLVGSTIGSHRLFERLSPKKSWEGFFGGLLFSVVAGYLASILFPTYFGSLSSIALACMGLIVSVFSTWGDLFESMIKRRCSVKDSGNLIPGHGGILDRIDSLLFVAPTIFIFLILYYITSAFQIIGSL